MLMYQIYLLNKISPVGLEVLPKESYQTTDKLENPHAILVRSADMHSMDFPSSVEAIARAGSGVNNIPLEKCAEKGIVVFNTPGANANGVKELAITGMLLASRKIVEGINWAKSLDGQGDKVPDLVEKGKSDFVGPEIKGKKLGVVGLGAIGVMVANAAQALGMEVIGFDPFISVQAAWGLSSSVKKANNLDQIFTQCDYISLHVPSNKDTKFMINKTSLAKTKKGVRIINLSRADLVKDADLKEGLESGIVAAYVTDFPNQELLNMKGVIPVPHLGASTPESEDNCAVMAAEQVRDYLENGNIKNSVNFPECDLGRCSSKARITVLHKNIPNILAQMLGILGNQQINVSDNINKSKGNWACTIIDADSLIRDSLVESIEKVEGVVKVRVLQ